MTIPAPDPQTFHWIKDALDDSLNEVMSQVRLVEQDADFDQLTTVPGNLHQIHGSLRMVELDAAGTLAEDLEALSQQLCGNQSGNSEATASLQILVQGLESLQGYVDAISRQTPLSPLDLAERINQVRQQTGREAISQLDLFEPPLDLLDLDSPASRPPGMQSGNGPRRVVPDEMRVKLVSQLRRKYRRALLSWLGNKGSERNDRLYLDRIDDLLTHLFHISSLDISKQLLWVAGGFVKAVASGDLNADSLIKTQFARLDVEISRLEDENISNIAVDPPDQLLRQMLFYIGAIAGAESERVREIQNTLHLTEWFDSDDSGYRALVQTSQQLHELGKEFGVEDFSGLEEALNTYFASFGDSGPDSPVNPDTVLTSLDKLSAGIDKTGLTSLSAVSDGLSRSVQATAQNPGALISTQADIKIASALLFIRDSIAKPDDIDATWQQSVDSHEQELIDLAGASPGDSESDLRVRRVAEIEHQHARSAVAAIVREILGDLEASLSVDNQHSEIPADQLAENSRIMGNLANVLSMVQSDLAAQVAMRLSEWLSKFGSSRVSPSENHVEQMAFAVAALGVSADNLANRGPKDDKVLETALERLGEPEQPDELADVSAEIPVEGLAEESGDSFPDTEVGTPGLTGESGPESGVLAENGESSAPAVAQQTLIEELDIRRRRLHTGTPDGIREVMESFDALSASDEVDTSVKKLVAIGKSVCTSVLDNDSGMTPEKQDFIGLLVRQIKDSAAPWATSEQAGSTATIDVDAWQRKLKELSSREKTGPDTGLSSTLTDYSGEQPTSTDSGIATDKTADANVSASLGLDIDSELSIPGLAQLDLDLRTIFIEELGSHLKTLKHCLNIYRATEPGTMEATSALTEIDDCVHTLSGNCRNLGFDEAADCAESAVAVLGNDRSIDRNARLAHFAESLLLLGQARIQVRDTGKYDAALREKLVQYLARSKVFHEVSAGTLKQEGLGADEDETSATGEEPEDETQLQADAETTTTVQPEQDESTLETGFANDSATAEITGDGQQAGDVTEDPEVLDIDEEIDEEIRQIFVEESASILGRINGYLMKWRGGEEHTAVLGGIRREFHTLKGSAAATGFSDVSALSHRIESMLENQPLDGGTEDSERNGKFLGLLEEIHDGLAVDLGIMQSEAKGHIPGLDKKIDHFLGVDNGDDGTPDTVADSVSEAAHHEEAATEEPARDESATDEPPVVNVNADESRRRTVSGSDAGSVVVPGSQSEDGDSADQPESDVGDAAGESVGKSEAGEPGADSTAGQLQDDGSDDVSAEQSGQFALEQTADGADGIVGDTGDAGQQPAVEQPAGNPDETSRMSGASEGRDITGPELHNPSGLATDIVEAFDDSGDAAIAQAKSWMPAFAEQGNTSQTADDGSSTGMLRINNTRLAELINASGELSLVRSQLQDTLDATRMDLDVLHTSMSSMRAGLRDLELEADAQVRSLPEQQTVNVDDDFDPLQLDRYSRLQAKSREVTELLDQLTKVERDLGNRTSNLDGALRQQLHLGDQLQSGLMSARMVTMAEYLPRLRFLVRETSRQSGKPIDLDFHGGDIHLDRQVAETMMAPFEHMIRNSVAHGIEDPAVRKQANKPESGTISLSLVQQGAELVVTFADDGSGLNADKLKSRAVELGLADSVDAVSGVDLLQVITQPGYSTADVLTMESGRGVGMDVVYQAVRDLGGSMSLDNRPGQGVTFQFRLPVTLALAQALLVQVGGWRFAVHSRTIERLMRVAETDIFEQDGKRTLTVDDQNVELFSVRERLGESPSKTTQPFLSVMLVRLADRFAAFEVDEFEDSVNIVSKSSGRQLASIPEISGVTVLGDSSIVLILDPEAFVEHIAPLKVEEEITEARPVDTELRRVLIVDDSLVVRKVMQKDLEADGLDVETAVDGVNALEVLERTSVDVALVDIEMPRMNGYELLEKLRSDERHQNLPVIIITSRSGEQHRERAMSLGADGYITKPYDISALDDLMREVVSGKRTLH